MATISTHKDIQARRAHNIRDKRVLAKLEHVNPELTYRNITLIDEPPREAYERIFGESVRKYNEKQKRTDRKITDYYGKMCKDKKHNPVYEMIIGVYPNDKENIPESERIEIMKEFFKRFEEENPKLDVIGAYIHLDETNPHMHLDFIPVGEGYVRGMEKQCSMGKALENQGYEGKSYSEPAVSIWNANMNQMLENICNEHGITVEHPDREKDRVEHLETKIYKLQQETAAQEEKLNGKKEEVTQTAREVSKLGSSVQQLKTEQDFYYRQCQMLKDDVDAFKGAEYIPPTPLKVKGEKVILNGKDYDNLISTAATAYKNADALSEFLEKTKNIDYHTYEQLKDDVETLRDENVRLRNEISNLNNDLKKKDRSLDNWRSEALDLRKSTVGFCVKDILDDCIRRRHKLTKASVKEKACSLSRERFDTYLPENFVDEQYENIYNSHKDKYKMAIQEESLYRGWDMER